MNKRFTRKNLIASSLNQGWLNPKRKSTNLEAILEDKQIQTDTARFKTDATNCENQTLGAGDEFQDEIDSPEDSLRDLSECIQIYKEVSLEFF